MYAYKESDIDQDPDETTPASTAVAPMPDTFTGDVVWATQGSTISGSSFPSSSITLPTTMAISSLSFRGQSQMMTPTQTRSPSQTPSTTTGADRFSPGDKIGLVIAALFGLLLIAAAGLLMVAVVGFLMGKGFRFGLGFRVGKCFQALKRFWAGKRGRHTSRKGRQWQNLSQSQPQHAYGQSDALLGGKSELDGHSPDRLTSRITDTELSASGAGAELEAWETARAGGRQH